MNYILFDHNRTNLLPLTFTRPVAGIRIGILTIKEKWEKYLGATASFLTEDYLSEKYTAEYTIDEDNMWLNGAVCPNPKLIEEITKLKRGQELVSGDVLIARNSGDEKSFTDKANKSYEEFESHAHAVEIK